MFKSKIKSITNHTMVLLAAAPLLAACDLRSGSSATTAPSPPPVAANTPASSAPAQAGLSASSSAPASSAGPALATADGEKPGVRIEVQEMKRTSGDTLTLKFALINDSAESFDFGYALIEQGKTDDYGSISGVNLIEGAGKKKYFVVRDTEGACLCSRGLSSIASKSRANLWAKFPAPPADVSKITVAVPHFIPMEDVPISQ
ncbi:MAG: hypothetical protein ACREAB_21225 [Blastocatellia bacterium]